MKGLVLKYLLTAYIETYSSQKYFLTNINLFALQMKSKRYYEDGINLIL